MNLFSWLLRYSSRGILLAIAAGGISGAASAAMIGVLHTAINNPTSSMSRHALTWLFVTLWVMAPATRIGSAFLIGRFGHTAIHDIRMRISRGIISLPLIQLEKEGPERLLTVLTDDLAAITDALALIPIACMNTFVMLGCLVFLGWLSPVLLVAFLVVTMIGVAGYQIPFLWSMRWLRRAREQWDTLFLYFRGLTEGNKELKLNRQRRESFLSSLTASSWMLRDYTLKAMVTLSSASSWGQALAFALVGVLVFAAPPWIARSDAVLNGYVLILLYMIGPMQAILNSLPTVSRASIAVRNVESIGLSLSQLPAEVDADWDVGSVPAWRSLRLIDVTHAYPGDEPSLIFHTGPINLTIHPREVIFLTGGNGSGKTTLAKIIVGLYLPDGGQVLIDEERLGPDTQHRHRARFTAIFSDYFLFERLFGFEGPDLEERVKRYLAALGLERKVDVKGGALSTTRLSHGQRSRLALLTAYLEDREIYLFDEWASDQDPHFRDIFYRQLLPQLKLRGKTVIVVSHDQHYFDAADRVIQMVDGKIATDNRKQRAAAVEPGIKPTASRAT